MQLYGYGTGWDILIIEMKTFLRLEVVRDILSSESDLKKDYEFTRYFIWNQGRTKLNFTLKCTADKGMSLLLEPSLSPGHVEKQRHALFPNLHLVRLFDIFQVQPTSLSLECLFHLMCCKYSLRKNISKNSI